MRRTHTILGPVVALVVALAFAHFNSPTSSPPPVVTSEAAPAQPNASEVRWTAPIWTGGEANAREHWDKHGREFPQFRSMQAYVDGAHAFLMQPPKGTLIKHRSNGDTLYFDPSSGIFAVQAANGAPRTFFRPDNGMVYWERQ